MTTRHLGLLILFASASVLSCIGSGSTADSRWEGSGCEPACLADDWNLPGHPECVMPTYEGCSASGASPVCPSGKEPSCAGEGPPVCEDGSKPSGCE